MRAALWLISLFALASGAAWLAWNNPGTVSLFWPPYRIDLSLNVLVLMLVLILLVMLLAQRALATLLALPRQAQRWRLQQLERTAHAALLDAMAQFTAGRYLRARKSAELALERESALRAKGEWLDHAPALRAMAHLMASEAGHALQDKAVRQLHLDQAMAEAQQAPHTLKPMLTQGLQLRAARWWLDDRDAAASLQQLAQLPTAVARRLVAMRMALKAARLAGQPAQALETAVLLAKHKAFTPAAAQSLLRSLSLEWLTQIRDQEALRRFWNGLPAFLREMPEVACETARRCQSLGGDVSWARQLLLPVWSRWMVSPDDVSSGQSQRLVEVLLQTLASASVQEAREWLLRFEQGLQARPRDVQMLYLSGLACHQQQLWGKAQQYLQLAVSLGLPPTLARPAWVALAELAQQRGDPDAALQAWKQAALQA